MFNISLEDLVYEITSRFEASITPAEVRALIGSRQSESFDFEEVFDILSEAGIDHESIQALSDINFERFVGVGILATSTDSFIFSRDSLQEVVVFQNFSDRKEKVRWDDFLEQYDSDEELRIFRFFERQEEHYGAIPGIETHWFFSPIWKNRRFLFQSGLAALLTNLFALGVSMFSMVVYNKIIPAQAMSSLAVLVTGMAFLLIADYAVKVSRAKFLGVAGIEADITIADRLFAKIIDLQYKSKKGSVGSLANTLKEYEQIREFFTSATLVTIVDMPFAIIFIIFIGIVGGWMVLPVLIGVAILIGATLYIQPRMKKISESAFEDGQNKHSVLVETLSGLETVKLLGAGGLLRRKFKAVLHRQAAISEQTKKHTYFATNLTAEVQQAVQIAVVAVGAVAVSQASSGYGAIIACTILSGKALAPFAQVAQLLLRLNQVVTGYKALDALMQQPAEHEKGVSYLPRGDIEGSVSFKEVTFSYPLQDGKALDGVTFEINPGERVAIVGRVGSGKTTIGKLTAKLFNPESGSIYIGGVDLLQLDPAEIRENIGYVSQEPWLIAGTIEQNITLGANEVTTEDLIWAARLSGAAEFIDAHPKGYKLGVRERGEGISGGQKQCITIARALVRRPKILIFDEPTSSMDVRTEKIFIDSFRKQKLDSTLILITHRTSLLSLVDRVLVVDSGKILGTESTSSFLSKSVKPSKNLGLGAAETSKSNPSSQVS